MTETTPIPIPVSPESAAAIGDVIPDITAVVSDVAQLRADLDQLIHHPSEATLTESALDAVVAVGAIATLVGALDGLVGAYVPAVNPVVGAILAGSGFLSVVIGHVVRRSVVKN